VRRPTTSDTETGVDLGRRLAPGTLLARRYRILGLLGVGGMGVVYRAHDDELDVDVAVKVLRPDLGQNPEWIERFRRETLLAREVTHPHVVRIHDIGESEGLRFLTMSYVEGRSLQDVLDKDGPLPPPQAAGVVRQLAAALQQAHDAGVVHRDLKPGNVLLDAEGNAYITDFGVARSLDRRGITREGAVVGTLDYLSPEQVMGAAVDGRSDLYALGILFYEMLTGELPFEGSASEVVAQRMSGRVGDLRGRSTPVPVPFQVVIRRCLERSPERRYQSARELIADLDRPGGPRPRGAAVRWAVAGAAVLAAALGAWALFRPRAPVAVPGPPAAVAARHAVAVLPLADETADPTLAWAGTGIAETLAARLAESPDLRVVEAMRLFRTLRDLQIEGSGDEHALRRLGELLGVDTLVAGSVRRVGGSVRVDLRPLARSASGLAPGRSLGAESEPAGLFRMVDGLAEQLRQELSAERRPAAVGPGTETASLEAATAYREGRNRMLVGDNVGAAPAFEKAVAADPAFAAAHEGLSGVYQQLGYQDKALGAAKQAYQLLRASRSALADRVQARLALLEGKPAEAERIYAELARRLPNDTAALVELADAQSAQGNLAGATETLKRVTALDPSDARAWFLLGKNAILMGESGRAVNDYLLRCLTLQTQLRNEQGQGDALNAIGAAYHQLGDYAQAAEKYGAAAALREKLGDRRGTAMTLKNRARTYLALSRYAEAEADLNAARRTYESIGDLAGSADVLNDFGALEEGRGLYAEALKAYQEALRVRRDLGDDRQLAQSYDNVGYIYYLQGEYDHARVYWTQAIELHRKAGERGGIILSTQNLGFLHTAQGRWDQAFRSFADALEAGRTIDYKEAMAVSFGNMGVLHRHEGRYAAAQSAFAQARAVLEELGDKRGLTEFALKEADALLELGRREEAKARLDAAEAWLRETGNVEQSADHATLLAQWHAAQGDGEAARRAHARASERAQQSHGRVALLRARIAEGAGLVELGDATAALAVLTPAAREADAIGDALLQIRAREALARAAFSRRRLAEAEDALRRATALAERCGWHSGLYRLHALRGRVLEARGDGAGAARAFAESARGIARLREGLAGDLRASFDALPAVREVEEWQSRQASSGGD
jgi:eukaryotic-like serine/threonine-protein kinase